MKVIGAELRLGVEGYPIQRTFEVKLVPVEVDFPRVFSGGQMRPTAEVTFHTSNGDVTVRAQLPPDNVEYHEVQQVPQAELVRQMAVLQERCANA